MKAVTVLSLVASAASAVAQSTARHYYTSDVNGEDASQNGFRNFPGYLLGFGEISQRNGTTPMRRCYSNTIVPGGSWFLTVTDNCEASGYQDQGILMYIYTTQVAGSQPLDRYYNPGNRDHIAVRADWFPMSPTGTSCDSNSSLVKDGTVGYILTTARSNTVPLYQFRKGSDSNTDTCLS